MDKLQHWGNVQILKFLELDFLLRADAEALADTQKRKEK